MISQKACTFLSLEYCPAILKQEARNRVIEKFACRNSDLKPLTVIKQISLCSIVTGQRCYATYQRNKIDVILLQIKIY
jgi:hypothetical protein